MWQNRFQRERQARKEAEKLLEEKSMEIWTINQSLEASIELRTQELQLAKDEAVVAMNQACEANRAKDTFLSNMSHELRTPLNAISGFSQILLARADTPDKVKLFIQKIYISGLHLLSLVNSILDFAKIESGKIEIDATDFSTQSLVDEVKILVEPMLKEKEITLITSIEEAVTIYADRQFIKQVLINLLSNAIKFSPNDEKILMSCEQNEYQAIFAVIDHGYGIPVEKIATLFDPFVQVREAQSDSIKGTGLGLSIVKKIVELHGGEVWIKSVEGEGSGFYFSLPKSNIDL